MCLYMCVCPYVSVHVCVPMWYKNLNPPIPLDAPLHNGQAPGLGTAEIKQDLY